MTIQELIDKFLTITNYDKNDNILAIIFYGSRVSGKERPTSDLDVLVIDKRENNYKKGFLLEGIRVDCHIYAVRDIFQIIDIKKENNNTFLEAILKTGLIVKDMDETIEMLKDYEENINISSKKKKEIPKFILEDIRDLYNNYQDKLYTNDFYYFNLLEKIRIAVNYLYGCSYLGTSKVYKIFSNFKDYQDRYLIKLPNKDFIDLYLKAITGSKEERDKILIILISYLHININEIESSNYYNKNIFYSEERIKEEMLVLHNKLLTTIDLLLINHPYGKMLYAIVLQSMYEYYYKIYHKINYELEELYQKGIKENKNDVMIEVIREVFTILSEDYEIDYDNYLIRLELVN